MNKEEEEEEEIHLLINGQRLSLLSRRSRLLRRLQEKFGRVYLCSRCGQGSSSLLDFVDKRLSRSLTCHRCYSAILRDLELLPPLLSEDQCYQSPARAVPGSPCVPGRTPPGRWSLPWVLQTDRCYRIGTTPYSSRCIHPGNHHIHTSFYLYIK